jgi:hypothetical protein
MKVTTKEVAPQFKQLGAQLTRVENKLKKMTKKEVKPHWPSASVAGSFLPQ